MKIVRVLEKITLFLCGGNSDRGHLTEEEFEEYEFLEEVSKWHDLNEDEQSRFDELHNKMKGDTSGPTEAETLQR